MHHRLKSLSIRSWADELPKPRFSCLLAATEPGLGPKKRAGRYELDHFTTYQSRQISSANAAESRLARQTQSLYNSFAATEIWDPGPGRAGPAGLLPGKTGFFFRAISCPHAVFVEFCSETQCQAITARFLVQISCSSRDGLLIGKIFDRGAALEFTNS